MIKHFAAAILILCVGMLQNTLLHSLPYARFANMLLVIFICLVLLAPAGISAAYAAVIGLALGSFLFMPVFAYVISALIVWGIVKALYVYLFSGFSLLSNTISILVATISYDLVTHGILWMLRLFDLTTVQAPLLTVSHLSLLGWSCLANILLMSAVFIGIARVSRLLNLSFITSKRPS